MIRTLGQRGGQPPVEMPNLLRPHDDQEWQLIIATSCTAAEIHYLSETYDLRKEESGGWLGIGHDFPRFLLSKDHFSFTMLFPSQEPVASNRGAIQVERVLFILHRQWLIVFSEHPVAAIEQVVDTLTTGTNVAQSADVLLARFLQEFASAWGRQVEPIIADSEEITDQLNVRGELFLRIRTLRKHAREILLPLSSQARLLQLFNNAELSSLPSENKLYFLDIADQMRDYVEHLAAIRDNLLESVEGYTSIQSNHMNKVMKTLTIVSTIFLPATLIASIYGMNFKIPEYGWAYGYAYSLTLMVVIAAVSLLIMRKKGWF